MARRKDGWDPGSCQKFPDEGFEFWEILKPEVDQDRTEYPEIKFELGDVITWVEAGGCVNVGSGGDDSKDYVHPTEGDPQNHYFGTITVPGAFRDIRFKDVKSFLPATVSAIEPSGMSLILGYDDDDNYSDNSYNELEDGDDDQCAGNYKLSEPEYGITSNRPETESKSKRRGVRVRIWMKRAQPVTIPPDHILSVDPGEFAPPYFTPDEWRAEIDALTQGHEYLHEDEPPFEWNQLPFARNANAPGGYREQYEGHLRGLSGTAVGPRISDDDVPFTHPFGRFDWECFVSPDERFLNFLAPSNFAGSEGEDPELKAWNGHALALGRKQGGGFPIETDRFLLPPAARGLRLDDQTTLQFRPDDGDRVAVWGRWVVDAGHNDFHSEIHPPLLLAKATELEGVGGNRYTYSTLIGRPYLVNQYFGGKGLRDHLLTPA